MRKKSTFCLIVGAVLLFAVSTLAGTAVNDVVKMDNGAYEKHKKGIVTFSHKQHAEEYGAKCGECHHDDKNQPLNDLKMGDNVQNCIECHKIPGEKPKGKGAPKLSKKEELQYHAEAIHDNCRGCHKKYNKEKGLKRKDPGYAPTSCKQCHN